MYVSVMTKNLPRPPSPSPTRLVSQPSLNSIFRIVVRCGGFRALYGWLGDVWERVRAHKLPRAGPPDWRAVGGRVYVEDLLGVLARVPISVDMLRETASARGGSDWALGGCKVERDVG